MINMYYMSKFYLDTIFLFFYLKANNFISLL